MRTNGQHRERVVYRLAFTAEMERQMRGMNNAQREAFLNARVASLTAERDALDVKIADLNEAADMLDARTGME